MSYDKPNRIKHSFGVVDFGGGADVTLGLRGPKGKAGRLFDYGVEGVIETCAGGTTTPKLEVGKVGTVAAYGAALDFGTLAAGDAQSVRSLYDPVADKTHFDALMVNRDIPADTLIIATAKVATGAGPAGQGVPFVIIDWDD